MISVLNNNPIRRAFSEAAAQYDFLTHLHKEIGRELIKKEKDVPDCHRILDVGMGTGWLTGRIVFYFPESKVIGIDFAPGMVEFAKQQGEGFQIVQGDAEILPFKAGSFDMILSNLAFQWIEDLQGSFNQCHRILRNDGRFSLTLFGYNTLHELFASLEHSLQQTDKNKDLTLRRLASQKQVATALTAAGFKDVKVDYEKITIHFPTMLELMKWIKDIGANALQKDIYIGKNLLLQANEYYNKNFKDRFGVSSTFEVIWAEGRK